MTPLLQMLLEAQTHAIRSHWTLRLHMMDCVHALWLARFLLYLPSLNHPLARSTRPLREIQQTSKPEELRIDSLRCLSSFPCAGPGQPGARIGSRENCCSFQSKAGVRSSAHPACCLGTSKPLTPSSRVRYCSGIAW